MKKVARQLSVISCSLLLLSGCASDSAFMSLFGQEAETDYSKNDLPTLGSTNFEPIKISKVGNTGTLVGQKVIAYRNELTELQDSMLQKTQGNVVVMDENANILNKIYNQAVSDISVVNNLLDSIRATYSVSGAIDEDHTQLRTLENETSQTAILLNSLISEVGSDYSRQLEYTNTARHYLAALDRAIKVGSYGIGNAPLPRPNDNQFMSQPQQPQPFAHPRMAQPTQDRSVAGISGKPLFAARFNHNNVNYKDSLQRAVKAAQNKNRNFRYEVVAVTPTSADSNLRTNAQSHAASVFQELVNAGINPDKIDVLSKTSPRAAGAEVQVFVK